MLFNYIIDVSRIIISKNKFRYDSNRISGMERVNFSKGWRNNYLLSSKLGYDHKKIFQNITVDETLPKNKKLKLDKYNII